MIGDRGIDRRASLVAQPRLHDRGIGTAIRRDSMYDELDVERGHAGASNAGDGRHDPHAMKPTTERDAAAVPGATAGGDAPDDLRLLPEMLAQPRLSLRDPRTRWGSASRSGRLSFSWRLILAPPDALETVVCHELAHLRVFGHGPRFWALVETRRPDHRVWRRWLHDHSTELHRALLVA